MAVSPDDKWLYMGSVDSGSTTMTHAVFRLDLTNPAASVTTFLGKEAEAGSDNAHFRNPLGVACDAEGRIYVADSGNNRIQIFKPDGTFLATLPVQAPHQVAVNRKTGAVYASQFLDTKRMRLVKFANLNSTAPVEGPILEAWHDDARRRLSPLIAVDDSDAVARVWVRQYNGNLACYEDAGTAFRERKTGGSFKLEPGWESWRPWEHQCHMTADPAREELYCREGGMSFGDGMIRVDGRTGKVIDRFGRSGGAPPFNVEHAKMAPDGKLYIRALTGGQHLVRYDPATGMLDTMANAQPFDPKSGDFKGKPFSSVLVRAALGPRGFQDVMGIAPNGDLYIPCGAHPEDVAKLKEAQQPVPREQQYDPFYGVLLKVYDSEGKLKCLSALPGLGPSQGIGIGRRGEVYIALECQPLGVKQPDGLAADATVLQDTWGTVVKFNSRFDKYPVGYIHGRWNTNLNGAATHFWTWAGFKNIVERGPGPVRIENMLWDYPGFSLMKGSSCNCPKAAASMDGFERFFLPALHTCTVNVLDANGNVIVRIGGYGNMDSRGPDSPVKDPKTGELRPRRADDPKDLKSPLAEPDIGFAHPNFTAVTDEALYVNDRANCRIVRARLVYAAEEVVALP
ncbi:MAG: SMP-30/gluconolactonase/LRE family protein [Planctomycetota bacterium]|nr:SMP-30/gluconolactonase/LRE family protein [Planctomycetota bacterium]